MTLSAVLLLAAGTYALRLTGPLLRERISVPERAQRLLSMAAIALLAALVATAAFTAGGGLPVGPARAVSRWARCWRGVGCRLSPW